MSAKNILIICYTFPPAPGIGGRRWAKFSKYLTRSGINVSVFAAKSNKGDKSLWTKDVEGINITRLNSVYPTILSNKPTGLIGKIIYKLRLFQVKLSTKGNYYDRGIFLEHELKKKILHIIQQKKISTIIVSGAPFNLPYFVCKLKTQLQNISIITDLRDPWAWKGSYGIKGMSRFRQKEEHRKELFVLEQSDMILVPTEIMRNELCTLYKNNKNKIKLIEHGFDEDVVIQPKKSEEENKETKFIIYGALYIDIQPEIAQVAKVLNENKTNSRLDIYSDYLKYDKEFEKYDLLNKTVYYHPSLYEKELYQKLVNSTYYLFICPNYGKDNLPTKMFELIYHKVPIIFVSEYGVAGDFIKNNNLGIFIHKSEISTILPKIINGTIEFNYNYDFDVSSNSFEILTQKLITFLK